MERIHQQDEDHILVPFKGEQVNPVAFGRVLGRLEAQAEDIKELKDKTLSIDSKLDLILEYQHKQRGAAKVVVMFSSAVASLVGILVSWWFNK